MRSAMAESAAAHAAPNDEPVAAGDQGGNGNGGQGTFDKVMAQLRARLGSEVYASWFQRMQLAETSTGQVRLSVPTTFLKSWVNSH